MPGFCGLCPAGSPHASTEECYVLVVVAIEAVAECTVSCRLLAARWGVGVPEGSGKGKSDKLDGGACATVIASVIAAVAAVLTAFVTPIVTASVTAQAVSPEVRVSSFSWGSDGHQFFVNGDVSDVQAGQRVWLFSTRSDKEGGVHPSPKECSVAANKFECTSWAGDRVADAGEEFTVIVAIVDAQGDDMIRDYISKRQSYDLVTDIPALQGTWASHSITETRPA